MLKGEKVILRAEAREDLKRLHELTRNLDLVVLSDAQWQPESTEDGRHHGHRNGAEEAEKNGSARSHGAFSVAVRCTVRATGSARTGTRIVSSPERRRRGAMPENGRPCLAVAKVSRAK